tara:strand:+ start:245 stop:760 length:516 start_codon:yes stop_codon:yes gene_type:complete
MQLKLLKQIKNALSVYDLLDQEKPPRVVFNTQRDNRVDDKICLQLAGVAFEIDDPLRPIIPDDTHPNCRCFYTDEITGQIVTDISSKRDIKRRKKLPPEQRHYLTEKREKLIVKTMEQNEDWQSKSDNFIPSDDTGIRPLDYDKQKLRRKDLRPYDKASLEQISKWIKAIV